MRIGLGQGERQQPCNTYLSNLENWDESVLHSVMDRSEDDQKGRLGRVDFRRAAAVFC